MLDRDLAKLYGVTTGNLNKAVKRNIERFPERYMFQLTTDENLKFQNGISSWGGSRSLPYVFTEQGVAMLSSVLHSSTAIQVSISIIDAFVAIRSYIISTSSFSAELEAIKANPDNTPALKSVSKPAAVNITPMIAVTINPMNTAAGTFLMYKIKVIKIPIIAKSAGAVKMEPIPTKVAGSATIIQAPFNPINAKKKPIPAPIA